MALVQGGPAIPAYIINELPTLDAFGRQRSSNPFTLFDSKQIWNDPDLADNVENYPLFWDNQQLSGSGTGTTFNVNRASTTLSVSASTAGVRARQTRQRFNYQPGKSQIVILTGVFGNTSSGNTKRYGYFDANNGLFFQDAGGVWSVVVRSAVSGSAVDTAIPQFRWNLDPLNGSGPSGKTLVKDTTQIFFIDFEWLGVGRVRFGFYIDGLPIYCHEVLNANYLTNVYMSTPNLPIRGEITNDGTGSADTQEMICATVISEGGLQPTGIFRAGNLGGAAADAIQANVVGTTYAVCGIRLKAAYLSAEVIITQASMIETAGPSNSFLWQIHFNPTLTSGLTYSDVAQSAVQFGVGLPAGDVITDDGHVLRSGYISAQLEELSETVQSVHNPGSLIDGTPDEIILSVTPLSANQDIYGSLGWQEVW